MTHPQTQTKIYLDHEDGVCVTTGRPHTGASIGEGESLTWREDDDEGPLWRVLLAIGDKEIAGALLLGEEAAFSRARRCLARAWRMRMKMMTLGEK